MNLNNDIIYEFKKSYSISYNTKYYCCIGSAVNIYDAKSGTLSYTFSDLHNPSFSRFLSDNILLVKNARGYYGYYDLESNRMIKKVAPPNGVKGTTSEFSLTPDKKYLVDFAYVFPYNKLLIMDTSTGEYKLYDFDKALAANVFYSQAESCFIISAIKEGFQNKSFYYYLKAPYDNPKIEKLSTYTENYLNIDYKCGMIAMSKGGGKILLYNTDSNICEKLQYDADGVLYCVKLSTSGEYIALAESNRIIIIHVISQKIIKTLDVEYGCFVDFCDNDSKLLVGTWEKGYCIHLFNKLQ